MTESNQWIIRVSERCFLSFKDGKAKQTSLNHATILQSQEDAEAIALRYKGKAIPLPSTIKVTISRLTYLEIQNLFGTNNPQITQALLDALIKSGIEQARNKEGNSKLAVLKTPTAIAPKKEEKQEAIAVGSRQEELPTPATFSLETDYCNVPSEWGI